VPVLIRGLRLDSERARHAAALALVKFGSRASPATDALIAAFTEINEHTSLELIGAYLEVVRKIGPAAGKAADAIVALLPERSRIYKDRPIPELILDLRAYMVMTLADIGAGSKAYPYILEHLAHSHPDTSYPFAAGAYAAGVLGPAAKEAVPLLLPALTRDRYTIPVGLDRPFATMGGTKATTARIEAIRALARIGPPAREAIPLLEKLAAQETPGLPLLRAEVEARKALKVLREK
jgi:HEAT repeat protein